jgi:hypothetical protein
MDKLATGRTDLPPTLPPPPLLLPQPLPAAATAKAAAQRTHAQFRALRRVSSHVLTSTYPHAAHASVAVAPRPSPLAPRPRPSRTLARARARSTVASEYSGGRTTADIVNWLKKKVQHAVSRRSWQPPRSSARHTNSARSSHTRYYTRPQPQPYRVIGW